MTPEEQAAYDAMQADLQAAKENLSAALDKLAALDQLAQAIGHLARDHRVWAHAFSGTPTIRTMGAPTDDQPPSAHLERLSRAALTDSIGEVCDGKRLGLEAHVVLQLRAVLGDPEVAMVLGELAKLRTADADTQTPQGVAAQTRAAVAELRTIADKLRAGGKAHSLATGIANTGTAPPPQALDMLCRLVLEETRDGELAVRALSAAQAVRTAFVGPPEPEPS